VRERTWLNTTDPEPMLRFMRDRTTDRRARLLVCAAARLVWKHLTDERSRRAVEVGELCADGRADADARWAAFRHALDVILEEIRADPASTRGLDAHRACDCVSDSVEAMWGLLRPTLRDRVRDIPLWAMIWWLGVGKISVRRPSPDIWCVLIRDIFGNPFRPVTFDPRWRTSDSVGLATGIYEDRAFDRLPILADALIDSGCDDEQVLRHCRSAGPHVRGCHVVDWVLAKE
jgi:hypothetical protein